MREVGRQIAQEIVSRERTGPDWQRLEDLITLAITQAVEFERKRCVHEHEAINKLTRDQQVEIIQLRDALERVGASG